MKDRLIESRRISRQRRRRRRAATSSLSRSFCCRLLRRWRWLLPTTEERPKGLKKERVNRGNRAAAPSDLPPPPLMAVDWHVVSVTEIDDRRAINEERKNGSKRINSAAIFQAIKKKEAPGNWL